MVSPIDLRPFFLVRRPKTLVTVGWSPYRTPAYITPKGRVFWEEFKHSDYRSQRTEARRQSLRVLNRNGLLDDKTYAEQEGLCREVEDMVDARQAIAAVLRNAKCLVGNFEVRSLLESESDILRDAIKNSGLLCTRY